MSEAVRYLIIFLYDVKGPNIFSSKRVAAKECLAIAVEFCFFPLLKFLLVI